MLHESCPKCGTPNDEGTRVCANCGVSNVVTPRVPGRDTDVAFGSTAPSPFEAKLLRPSDTEYDPRIIGKFADMLYRRADFIVFVWTAIGAVVGAILLRMFAQSGLLVGLLIGGLLGYLEGQARSFLLRLQAQLALCSVHIEINTRQ